MNEELVVWYFARKALYAARVTPKGNYYESANHNRKLPCGSNRIAQSICFEDKAECIKSELSNLRDQIENNWQTRKALEQEEEEMKRQEQFLENILREAKQ